MTGSTVIMLQVVGRINKAGVIHRRTMTAYTTRGRRYFTCMILRRMRRKVGRYPAMALTAIASRRTRQLGRCAMTDITVVML
jgi:hypothetical protein